MAYWKKNIKIEVRLPYITQGCTLGHLTAEVEVTSDSVWIPDECTWKSEQHWGDYRLLITGKFEAKEYDCASGCFSGEYTTCKVHAYNTHDGIRPAGEEYKVKVLSYN